MWILRAQTRSSARAASVLHLSAGSQAPGILTPTKKLNTACSMYPPPSLPSSGHRFYYQHPCSLKYNFWFLWFVLCRWSNQQLKAYEASALPTVLYMQSTCVYHLCVHVSIVCALMCVCVIFGELADEALRSVLSPEAGRASEKWFLFIFLDSTSTV